MLFGVPFCGQLENPGVAQDDPTLIDYSKMPCATIDQQRIEAVLDTMDLRQRELLHVGIGSSSLAMRFHGRCTRIDGITISRAEWERAVGMKLADYRAWRVNKYSSALPQLVPGPYDFIIDNNLASFACCGFHLLLMFINYRLLLKSGGQVLTEQRGMDWVVRDSRWRLSFDGLSAIARRLNMRAERVTETVFALVKP